MEWERITKRPEERAAANLRDYDTYVATFSWDNARALLDRPARRRPQHRLRGGRPPRAGRARRPTGDPLDRARRRGPRFHLRDALQTETNRFANVLQAAGIGKGDRVFSLLGRVPELYVAALGTLKNGSVFSPLFSAFGPEPIKARMTIGDASALVTTEAFYRRKVEPWRRELPQPQARLPHRVLRRPAAGHRRPRRGDGRSRRTPSTSCAPSPRTWRSCISPAARPAGRRAPSMSTRRWSPTTSPGSSRSTSTTATSSGAPPIPAG